jgi:calcium binding protein 39
VEYLSTREETLILLLRGCVDVCSVKVNAPFFNMKGGVCFSYENQEIALNCGIILRECVRHESLTKIILYSSQSAHFYKFFDYVELSTFDLASDAFATFKDLLTKHKTVVAEFLDKQYDQFFDKYTALLNSNNYVTKRQSLKVRTC